jgi:hypothetical protein
LASACKEFFGNQNRKWGTNGTCDNADSVAGELKAVKLCVVTGPSIAAICLAGIFETANDVAVWI